MKGVLRGVRRARNFWIVVALLLANGLAWNAAASLNLPEARPFLHPEIAAIRDRWRSGQAAGESFSIVVTEQMAAETAAWFLSNHPEIPFSHPQAEIDPGGVTVRGLAHLLGLRTPVYGRVSVWLEEGVPKARLEELGVASAAAPGFLIEALRAEIDAQQRRFNPAGIPVTLTRLEFREGEVLVEGLYR
ncbi:MAG: hypothetical protein L0332_12300 [Chloroflexi bacterium]|nr:hypothetical protein [Chloroflexota bacterium]MCI0645330.1 hypothetical protein [Chloroflexota bacterium]MCI0727487.1 hypothetical protein [Chloroflexota bacterium]